MTSALNVGFPNGPVVDRGGLITPAWRAWALAMMNRTGGAIGISSGDAATQIAAEAAARQSADTALSAAIANEAVQRTAAIADEASVRAAADTWLVDAVSNLSVTAIDRAYVLAVASWGP